MSIYSPFFPHLVIVMKVLAVQLLDGFLEFLGLLDKLGSVVQPRLHGTQLHLQVMHLREEEGGGVESQRTKVDDCDIHRGM